MTRLTYVKGDDINDFIQKARVRLDINGYVVLRVEPGDATRYDFIITELPRDYVVSLINLNQCTALIGKTQLEVGTGQLQWLKDINVCTDGLVCEVYSSMRAGKALGKFFDWRIGHYTG